MKPDQLNNNLYKFISENTSTLVVITDIDGKITWVNKAFEQLTEYSLEEVIGKKPGEILQGEKTDKEVIALMSKEIEAKNSFKVEILNYSKSGVEYWLLIECHPTFNSSGELENFVAFEHEITESKLFQDKLENSLDELKWRNYELEDSIQTVEREIKEKETLQLELLHIDEILKETQKAARIGSWEIDLVNDELYWSNVVKEIHEVDINFIPDITKAIDFYHPDYIELIQSKVNDIIENGISFYEQMILITSKGNEVWVRAIGYPVYKEKKIVKIRGVFQDITKEKNAEFELKQNEENLKNTLAELEAIINNNNSSIYTINRDYEYTAFNKLHSEGVKHLLGIDIYNGLSAKEGVFKIRGVQESLEILEKVFQGETINLIDDVMYENEFIYYETNYIPIKNNNEIIGAAVYSTNISEKIKKEIEREDTIIKLDSIINNTESSIYAIDAYFCYTAFNKRHALGIKNLIGIDIYSGLNIKEVLLKPHDKIIINILKRALAGEAFTNIQEFDINGEIYYYESSLSPILKDGTVIGATVFTSNISERIKNVNKLKESEDLFRNISSNSPFGIYMTDKDGNYTYINESYQKITGLDFEKAKGNGWANSLHPNDKVRVFQTWHAATLNEKFNFKEIYRFVDINNNITWVETTAVEIKVENELKGYLGFVEDITQKKQIEQELYKVQILQKAIIDNATYAMIATDLDGTIIVFNKAAEGLLGYEAFELVNKQNPGVFHLPEEVFNRNIQFSEELAIDVEVGFETFIIKTKLGFENVHEWIYVHKNGKHIPVLLSISALRNQIDEITGYIGIAYDISQRKQYEENLKKAMEEAQIANKAKSSFLANMSHEIRTPMNAILGFGELLSTEHLNPKQNEYLNGIVNSGKSLLNIINEILDLSKIDAGKLIIKKELTNIENICNDIASIFIIKLKEKQLDFNLTIQPDFPKLILIDDLRVRQILLNLIGNAIKFTEKGQIDLKINFKHSNSNEKLIDLIIEVADTGIGIPEDQQEIIFDVFRQQDEQSTRKYGGTGLGLSITKRLTEMMGGKVELESRVGVGSNFKIIFNDIEYSNENRFKIIEKPILNYEFRDSNVLVVDDNETNQLIVKSFLKNYKNLNLSFANNGLNALEIFEANDKFDLILMDIQMPELDGNEACKIIKNLDSHYIPPIIALTAHAMKEDIENLLIEFDSVITKPIVRKKLLDTLSKYIGLQNSKNLNLLKNENYDYFYNNFIDKAIKYQQTIDMEAINQFTNELKEFAFKSNEPYLIEKSEELEVSLKSFNISKMMKNLEELSKIAKY